jgi:EAL domain-containing protein (putative c-di-GMP-specific phosphodiesterase class I)/GGDEF domain-containing protein
MLLSELEERERRFKLALRAGIPIILLISLVFYSTFFRDKTLSFNLETAVLFGSLVFIIVYFIYFLMELSIKESLIDQTTQSFNEKAFVNKLEKYRPKTLVMLIVKNLSTINEHYSTKTVDNLLYTLIHRLNHSLKIHGYPKALIARRYGAEFLIAIDQDSPRIEQILQEFIKANTTIDQIEVDYVFAAITNISEDLEKDLFHLKDLISVQLQKKKPSDKTESYVKDAKELSSIENAIIEALKAKELRLSFRPLLNTKTNKIDIYEISVKLYSPTNGTIPPKTYLPTINRLGMGREYDRILYMHIIKLLPLIDDSISLSFNLSPFSLRDETFQKEFFRELSRSKISPHRLIIELYERKTHHNLSGYLKTLDRFRKQGIRIAIDNFGSSNASMEYMKHFHFDIVQFDRDYVGKLEDKNSHAMLNSLIIMAKDLQITTVAKWVDKPQQKEKLINMGIDYLQGFGIAKPIQEQELIALYN